MTKWQGLSALLFLGGAVGCATATSSNLQGGGDTAGADSGGSGSGGPSGGSDALGAGAPGAGAPGASAGAPSAGAATGGSSSAGAANAGSSSGGKPSGGGAAGQGGAAGHAGAVSGGSSGTSSSAGSAGTAGGTSSGPCANPKDVKMGNSQNFDTTGPVCLRTTETFNTIGCANWGGRTVKVNGVLAMCNVKTTFAPMIDGYNYFDVTAGDVPYAAISWYTQ